MSTIQVHPKVGSYVDEWVAAQFKSDEGVLPVKKLLKGTGWVILQAVINGTDVFMNVAKGNESWRVNHGDWVVKSPHDKVWFMSPAEFASQFLLYEET